MVIQVHADWPALVASLIVLVVSFYLFSAAATNYGTQRALKEECLALLSKRKELIDDFAGAMRQFDALMDGWKVIHRQNEEMVALFVALTAGMGQVAGVEEGPGDGR